MLVDNALSDADLEKAAQAADTGEAFHTEPAEPEESRSSSSTDASNPKASTAATQAGAEGNQEPVVSSSDTPAAGQDPAESKFKKAQKEKERRERSWQMLEQEKSSFRKERDEYLAERKRYEEERTQAAATREPYRDEHGHTADDYAEFAAEQKRKGHHALAQRAEARAEELRAQSRSHGRESVESSREQSGSRGRESVDHPPRIDDESWNKQIVDVLAQVPELSDENHPLSIDVAGLLAHEPMFSQDPEGFAKAVTVSRLRLEAARVPELLKQVETQKSEIEKLNRALSIGGSNPLKPGQQRTYDGMSEAEKDDFIARQAAEADSAG